jgi:hypothetical protein
MVYRLIAAEWAKEKGVQPGVLEGEFDFNKLLEYNEKGYNCYFLPNYPSKYDKSKPVSGKDIDIFKFIFVDMDLKDGVYKSKEHFIEKLKEFLPPTIVIDSGNGVHVYWEVTDLDGMSYLRLQRRLIRHFNTDDSLATLYQLMRVPDTLNVKLLDSIKQCEVIHQDAEAKYVCEEIDKALPKITVEDEAYCKDHYEKTHNPEAFYGKIDEEIPAKFINLMNKNEEIKKLFMGPVKDRSAADFRLGHLLFANGLTQEEATSVLLHTAKASERSKVHRYNYAINIVEKVWKEATSSTPTALDTGVMEILRRNKEAPQGIRIKCDSKIDATYSGFRLTEVLGIVGKEGNGKTTWALNIFKWFIENSPEYIHVFVSLEQPDHEIAERLVKIFNGDMSKSQKIHILGNYNADGTYRNLSFVNIRDYVQNLEKITGQKVGCVVIDYLDIIKKENKGDERHGLIGVCSYMKTFAITTNTFLIMLSQSARGKGGIGDVELDIDSAYGTSKFEAYCDYMMTTWQPLKRLYDLAPSMTVTAFKMCKIRKFNIKKDNIKKDCVYTLMFDQETEQYRKLTDKELKDYEVLNRQASELRNADRTKEPSGIRIIDWTD